MLYYLHRIVLLIIINCVSPCLSTNQLLFLVLFCFLVHKITGFIVSLDGTTQENKMRFIQNFKWTDTLQGNTPRLNNSQDN